MSTTVKVKKKSLGLRLKKDLSNFGGAYLMGIPVIIFYIILTTRKQKSGKNQFK